MRFDLFGSANDAHLRKSRDYLHQAHMARLEHQMAADHHAALALMYAQRIAWLEQELTSGSNPYTWPAREMLPQQEGLPQQRTASVISWLRSHNSSGVKMPT